MLINKLLLNKEQYTLPFNKNLLYKLDVIQNYFPPHPDLESVVNKCNNFHEYPYQDDVYMELLNNIAKYYNTSSLCKDMITLTGGSDMALKAIIEAFVVPKSKVLIPVPTYPHFESFIANVLDESNVYKPVVLDHDYDDILSKEHYDLVYLVSPNLPLGTTIDKNKLKSLLEKYTTTMFILDEAYIEYTNDTSNIEYIYKNLIIVRTFSKAFGLAGLRIGYFIAHPEIKKMMSPVINDKNVTNIAIHAANFCLNNIEYYNSQIDDVQKNIKPYLKNELDIIIDKNSMIYDYSIKDGNYFMLFAKDTQKVCSIFMEHGIAVRDKSKDLKDSIRICMGPKYMMEDVVGVIKFINMRYLIQRYPTIFDLDGTLRKHLNKWYSNSRSIVESSNANSIILTNNQHAKDPYCIRPFIRSIDLLDKEYNILDIKTFSIEKLLNDMTNGKPFCYLDTSQKTTLDQSEEFSFMQDKLPSDTTIPDSGAIAKWLQDIIEVENCSKQNKYICSKEMLDSELVIVIGDTSSDIELYNSVSSQRNGKRTLLIKVMEHSNIYNFKERRIDLIDIDQEILLD